MQVATCHSCGSDVAVECLCCLRNSSRKVLDVVDAEIIRSKNMYEKKEETTMTVRAEGGTFLPLSDSKHFVAVTISGYVVGTSETKDELFSRINDFLRRVPTETVIIYESVSSVAIKLDTETKSY